MSYCRFSGGDVYMFPSIRGGICCQRCELAELVPTIFTTGVDALDIEPCEHCDGEGCERCMLPGELVFYTRSEAIEHLLEHRKAGHEVPQYAIDRLQSEPDELGETYELGPIPEGGE